MAKRFTDIGKWKKPFIKGLPPIYKLLWMYIIDDCDHCGIWQVDFEVASLRIGQKLNHEKALKLFGDKITIFEDGAKWFIPGFIDFQYGELNPKNRVHESVLKSLAKYNLINKPLTSPLQGVKDKEEDKDEDKEKDVAEEIFSNYGENVDEKFLIPEMLKVWKKHNPKYPTNKAKDFPPLQSLAVFICEQDNLNYHAREPDDDAKILTQWGSVSAFIVTHHHFKNYNLILVEKHIQAIFSTIQNAGTTNGNSKTNTGTKPGTSAARMQTARNW